MNADDFESKMRAYECFHSLKVIPDAWIVIRVDGRSFTQLADTLGLERPFDNRFHEAMFKTAKDLLAEFHGIYAFTESDEISVLLPFNTTMFSREVEKLVSISASVASSTFSRDMHTAAHFDSRLWVGPTIQHVIDYFRWRQADAERCGLNAWAYWSLRKAGVPPEAAHAELMGKDVAFKNELLFSNFNINYNNLPAWQKRGTGITQKITLKAGLDPRSNEVTSAVRKSYHVDEDLPFGEDYAEYVKVTISEWMTRAGFAEMMADCSTVRLKTQ